ncbi:MAG: hypothetical protein QM718_10370 [Steroidobacteraceae bacterium]
MSSFTESVVEEAALAWLKVLGYAVRHGLEIAAGELVEGVAVEYRRKEGAVAGTQAQVIDFEARA